MTIGIAAWGPNAGRAILLGLQAAERVGSGAIGGFVSWVALGGPDSDQVWRAETQRLGTAGLFSGAGLGALPAAWSEAACAGLMSSGPNRPEPLAQFTPARAGIGLVTGHRLPNTLTGSGIASNEQVLRSMAAGMPPSEALHSVLKAWPGADAGIIALGVDGRHAMGNTATVQRRGDLGSASWGARAQGALAIVIHNSIQPKHSLAALVCEVVWNAMRDVQVLNWITLSAGVAVRGAHRPAVWVDAAGSVTQVDALGASIAGLTGIGLGDRVAVFKADATPCGWLGYEPYLMVENGRVISVDGERQLRVPVTP